MHGNDLVFCHSFFFYGTVYMELPKVHFHCNWVLGVYNALKHTHTPVEYTGNKWRKSKTAESHIPETRRPHTVFKTWKVEWRKHLSLEWSSNWFGLKQQKLTIIISVWICILQPLFSLLALVLYFQSENANTCSTSAW